MPYLVEAQLVPGVADRSPISSIESHQRSMVCITVRPVSTTWEPGNGHPGRATSELRRGADSLEHATWEDAEWR